jgi:hypothetical protein
LPIASISSSLVAHRGRHALPVDDPLQRLEDLGAAAQRLPEALRTDRHDHQLLHVQPVVGVRAAVDDIHHRHRHAHRAGTAEIAVERQPGLLARRARRGHRNGKERVRAEARLVLGAVEVEKRAIDERLLGSVETDDRLGNFRVHELHGLQHALAAVTSLVAVAQLDRLERAGGGAGRDRSAADGAVVQAHLDLDGRVATRVENLPGDDRFDGGHVSCRSSKSAYRKVRV